MSGRVRRRADALGTYVGDHYAGATGGLELTRSMARAHRDRPSGPVLATLAAEIAEDRVALREIMTAVGAPVPRLEVGAAWLGEKLARLKLQGPLAPASSPDEYLQLETLLMGVHGKWAGWRTLRALAEHDRRLPAAALEELCARAERQVHALEELRAQALGRTFGTAPPS